MLAALLTTPVTITSRTGAVTVDELGDPVRAEATVETSGALQQRDRDEQPDDLSQTEWVLVLPAGTSLGAADSVDVDGQAFEVVGEPWPVTDHLTGRTSHVEASLRRVT